MGFLKRLPCDVHTLDDYLQGDCTIALIKHPDQASEES